MEGPATSLVLRLFDDLPDPRARNRSHLLSDIVTIAILATLCGAEGWEEIAEWAEFHQDWLRTFLTLRAGIPSHDTIDNVFKRLDPDAFEKCFMTWTTARRSFTRAWPGRAFHRDRRQSAAAFFRSRLEPHADSHGQRVCCSEPVGAGPDQSRLQGKRNRRDPQIA